MKLVYSEHAIKRMKQRGITELEVEFILEHPMYIKKTFEGRQEAVGVINNRMLKIIVFETESYLKIITLI